MIYVHRPARVVLLSALLFALACGGGGVGGPNSTDPNVGSQLIVQQTLPTNGQEVLDTLGDAGEEQDAGHITVRFSEGLDPSLVLDPNNALDGLSSDVNLLDSSFHRVPGTPSITGPRGNVLIFTPASPHLDKGQYTITVSRDVRSKFGAALNKGQWDFRSSFTVGPDSYAPVIRSTFPAENQKGVGKSSDISVMFNESLNPATVNASTFSVAVTGNPPQIQNGTITLSHDNFEITFTPDSQTPLPPNATIVVTITGGSSGITDAVNNPFAGIPSGTDSYQFQFETVKEPPLPKEVRTFYDPSLIPPYDTSIPQNAAVYYGADDRTGVIEEMPYINNWNDLTTWGTNNPVPNSETQLSVDGQAGRVGEILVDPRFNPTDGHSWYYVTDVRNRVLNIFGSRDCRIVYTWKDLPDPTGLAVRPGSYGLSISATSLYVTNRANDTVSMINIGQAAPVGTRGLTDAAKALASYQHRTDLKVGRGPTGIAHSPPGTDSDWLLVCNTLGDSVTCINSATFVVDNELNLPASPTDIGVTNYYVSPLYPPYTIGRFAYVTCAGTGVGDGKLAFLWKSTLNLPPLKVPSGHWNLQGTVDTFKSPQEVFFDGGSSAWIADADANEAVKVTWYYAGASVPGQYYFTNPQAQVTNRVSVGDHPTGITMEPFVYFYTLGQSLPIVTVVACQGSGDVTFIDNTEPSRPTYSISIPKVHTVSGYFDE